MALVMTVNVLLSDVGVDRGATVQDMGVAHKEMPHVCTLMSAKLKSRTGGTKRRWLETVIVAIRYFFLVYQANFLVLHYINITIHQAVI